MGEVRFVGEEELEVLCKEGVLGEVRVVGEDESGGLPRLVKEWCVGSEVGDTQVDRLPGLLSTFKVTMST